MFPGSSSVLALCLQFVRGAAEELVVTTGQGSEDFEPSLDTGGDELYAFNE